MGVLDDRVGLERRDPPPEARGPPGAAEPRIRRSNEAAGRDEQNRRSGGGDRELLEAGHVRSSRARANDSSTAAAGAAGATLLAPPPVGILRSVPGETHRARRRSSPALEAVRPAVDRRARPVPRRPPGGAGGDGSDGRGPGRRAPPAPGRRRQAGPPRAVLLGVRGGGRAAGRSDPAGLRGARAPAHLRPRARRPDGPRRRTPRGAVDPRPVRRTRLRPGRIPTRSGRRPRSWWAISRSCSRSG